MWIYASTTDESSCEIIRALHTAAELLLHTFKHMPRILVPVHSDPRYSEFSYITPTNIFEIIILISSSSEHVAIVVRRWVITEC